MGGIEIVGGTMVAPGRNTVTGDGIGDPTESIDGVAREGPKRQHAPPVPLEISKIVPGGGVKPCNNTAKIGSRFRWVAGAYWRASKGVWGHGCLLRWSPKFD